MAKRDRLEIVQCANCCLHFSEGYCTAFRTPPPVAQGVLGQVDKRGEWSGLQAIITTTSGMA